MHKDRGPNSAPPFRPIVSSIGTYNYNLAKYLCNLLSPHIPTEHCATDTFTFVQDIQSLSMFGKFMVSFDVESLFTNIPLGECIDLAVNYISEGNPDLKLSKSELRSLFTVATAQTHFLFNGSFYDQLNLSTEDDRSFCRNMFCKFKSVVVFFKILISCSFYFF